jgi:hypothetical protein
MTDMFNGISLEDETMTIRTLRSQSNESDSWARRRPGSRHFARRCENYRKRWQLFDGVASMCQAFEQTFADPKFIAMVRCPESIDLNSTTAAEAGTWEAHVVRGKYLARWQRHPIGWRVAPELYIPL